jgi:hypothetical protein
MRGRDVLAVQRALARAKYRRWGHFTGRYGKKMGQQMTLFKKHHGIKEEGYGPKTHAKLARYFDRYGASLMLKMGAKLKADKKAVGIEAAIASALIAYNNRGRVHYTQGFGRMTIVRNGIHNLAEWFRHGHHLWEDCSSACTGFFFTARLPDPNGRGYDGQGYTGTLAIHGARILRAVRGALGFYGRFPYHHVVICVAIIGGVAYCVSHGGESGPLWLRYNYRGDFSHWRRYV